MQVCVCIEDIFDFEKRKHKKQEIQTLVAGNGYLTAKLFPNAQTIVQTTDFANYIYLISAVSLSLGITNLLPIPPLDGGKILIYIIEAIRRKPFKEETEVAIQMTGFIFMIAISIFVLLNDIGKL